MPPAMRCGVFLIVLMLAKASLAAEPNWLQQGELPPLPDSLGLAGSFAGTSNGALIVAGGSNFPDGPPWQGGKKAWHDRIFVLEANAKDWRQVEQRLVRPIAAGVSVS